MSESRKSIETQELRITDSEGRCRILLSAKDDSPVIQMFDSYGTTRIQLSFDTMYSDDGEHPEIRLFNEQEEWLVSIGATPTTDVPNNPQSMMHEGAIHHSEPHLYLCSRKGSEVSAVDLLVFSQEPMMLITHADSGKKFAVTIDEAGKMKVTENPFR